MALDKFTLKDEHLALIKNLVWDEKIVNVFVMDEELPFKEHTSPFGGDNVIEDMLFILNGERDEDFDPFDYQYTDGEIDKTKNLLKELRIALDITNCCGIFEVGNYSKKHHLRNWKKV